MLVLLVAGLLVAAAAGIVLLGRSNAEPYILAFLAVLATVGVFSLFALACGILRVSAATAGNPLIKAVVDGAFDGIVVTDTRRPRDLCQCRLSRSDRCRRCQRLAAGRARLHRRCRRVRGDLPAAQSRARGQAPAGRGAGRRLKRPAGALAALENPAARRQPARRAA